MKKVKSLLSLLIAALLINSSIVYAAFNENKDKNDNLNNSVKQEEKEEKKVEEKKEKEEKKAEEKKEKKEKKAEEKKIKEEKKELRKELEEQKDIIERKKDELEVKKEELKKQYEEVKESENEALTEELKVKLEKINSEKETLKNEMKKIKKQRKEIVKNNYTEKELKELGEAIKKIQEGNEDIKIVSVENILIIDKDVKFDTPPVIKEERILIPVRAITCGFGAEVKWNEEEKKVTIVKDDIEIILYMDSDIAIVNGNEVKIDVPSSNFCNRTYVPLRFIAENLGLKVHYDDEDELVEIEEEEDKEIDDQEEDETSDDK